jgi:hypothetical protein
VGNDVLDSLSGHSRNALAKLDATTPMARQVCHSSTSPLLTRGLLTPSSSNSKSNSAAPDESGSAEPVFVIFHAK